MPAYAHPQQPKDTKEILIVLQEAVNELKLQDAYLLDKGVHELAVAHRLAIYIEKRFPGWHIDTDYNRIGNVPKRFHGTNELFRPDIIVHRRGPDGPNLLALELKIHGSDEQVLDDLGKLDNYVSQENLDYNFVAFVHFGTKEFWVSDRDEHYADGHL